MSLDMYLRRPGADPAVYEPGDGKFTIKVNHGGVVEEIAGLKQYVGGEVHYFEHAVKETLSIVVLDKMAYLLEYRTYIGFYWRKSDLYDDGGWNLLISDEDVMVMAEYAEENRFVEIFYKHLEGAGEFAFVKYLEAEDEVPTLLLEGPLIGQYDEADVIDFTAPEYDNFSEAPANEDTNEADWEAMEEEGLHKTPPKDDEHSHFGPDVGFRTPPPFTNIFCGPGSGSGKKKKCVAKKKVFQPTFSSEKTDFGVMSDDDSDYDAGSLLDSEYSEDDDDVEFQQFVDDGLEDFDANVVNEVKRQYKEKMTSKLNDKKLPKKLFLDILNPKQSVVEEGGIHVEMPEVPDDSDAELKEGDMSSEEEPLAAPRHWNKKKEKISEEVEQDMNASVSGPDVEKTKKDEDPKEKLQADDYPIFMPERDLLNPKFEMGMLFSSKAMFNMALINYGIKQSLDLKIVKNDLIRIYVHCLGANCQWKLHANKVPGDSCGFQIRLLGPKHTCATTMEHKLASAKYIAKRYLNDFRSDAGVVASEFQKKVETELNVKININKVYKIKAIAKEMVEGSYKDQYRLIWDYLEELRRSNPGTTCYMETRVDEESGQDMFDKLYVCLNALKEGFKAGCRKVIGLDGTFLKGPHPGTLLTAVGLDANNGVYPVAYAIVESETKFTWKWFIEGIKDDLDMNNSEDWVIISDRQKGLGIAVADELPKAEHRHCFRHIHCNFKKQHPGLALKEQVWRCAKATYLRQFETEYNKLKELDENAYNWFVNHTHPVHWSKSHFKLGTNSDHILNNHCETFNRHLLGARTKPILAMLENIRVYLMLTLQKRRQWAANLNGLICPRIMTLLEKKKLASRYCFAEYSGGNQFEVRHGVTQEQFVVDTGLRSCSCRAWQLSGIPCGHAVAALSKEGSDLVNFVDSCYTIETYKKAYKPIVFPANGPNNWPRSSRVPVLPPNKLRQTGRPQLKRRLEEGENVKKKSKTLPTKMVDGREKLSRACLWVGRCGRCKQTGHNIRKCPLPKSTTDGDEGTTTISKNFNKCSKCKGLGHNKRKCPTSVPVGNEDADEPFNDIDDSAVELEVDGSMP